jgi:hypothetical protein
MPGDSPVMDIFKGLGRLKSDVFVGALIYVNVVAGATPSTFLTKPS